MRIRRWYPFVGFLVACAAIAKVLAFDLSYRYELVEGKQLEVCRHMLDIYITSFARPWADSAPPKVERGTAQTWETQYSLYPTTPEFEAIHWQAHHYGSDPGYSALFDIDNDGLEDLVVRVGFFSGTPGSWDYIWVFSKGAVDLSEFRTHDDFLRRIAPKARARIGYPIHQRPFLFNGRAYIHGYTYTPEKFRDADPAEPFAPPEYLLIREYRGGRADDADVQKRNRSMKLICKFNMIQQ
jgi:hypothetical protein